MDEEVARAGGPVDASRYEPIWTRLRQIERRQWWLWSSAIAVTLLLTAGMLSFAFPSLIPETDAFRLFNLRQAMRGLVGLVLLFDVYVIYQQLQIQRIRRQLVEQQELFRIISENAADMIAVVDTAGRRLYNSPSYQKALGYSPEELKATSAFEQIHPEDRPRVVEAAKEAKRTGMGRALEYRIRHKDGTWRTLESTASVARNSQGEIEKLIVVNRDITQRKQAEEALQETEKQLRHAQKMEAVGRLSGGLAHDFNNLLGVIIGYSDLLEMRMDSSDPLRKGVDEIKKAGQRAASLTRQLLAFSRKQMLEPRVLDLNAIVTEMSKMLRRLIGEDIELTTQLAPILGRVRTDQAQIEQVILNLALNARDAMPQGGKLTIETSNVELLESFLRNSPEEQPGRYVQLLVSDNGAGMDAETQRHIFEPFFTTKEPGKGTGLGLATVYGVVKQSGGFIRVSSSPGKGSTFRIFLPLVAGAFPTSGQERLASPTWSSQGWETVLLVEDEQALQKLVCDMLVQSGYKVLTANNGTEALEIARKHAGPVHLLLTDVVMAGMSGPDLARRITAARPEARILFMSGYADRPIATDKNLQSAASLLQKPFTRERLLRKVREAFDWTDVNATR